MTIAPPFTDLLSTLRADLAAILEPLGVPLHDYEPRSAGQVPLFYLGRPTLTFDPFGKMIVVDWPTVLVLHNVDTEGAQRDADGIVWAAWGALGGGAQRVLADVMRTFEVGGAQPTTQTIGDVLFATYELAVRFTLPVTLCDP